MLMQRYGCFVVMDHMFNMLCSPILSSGSRSISEMCGRCRYCRAMARSNSVTATVSQELIGVTILGLALPISSILQSSMVESHPPSLTLGYGVHPSTLACYEDHHCIDTIIENQVNRVSRAIRDYLVELLHPDREIARGWTSHGSHLNSHDAASASALPCHAHWIDAELYINTECRHARSMRTT